MKTQEFFTILQENQDKSLLFEYTPNRLVGTNYHITEVKHTTIDSVDCGAKTDSWNETIIQLWESPKDKGKQEYMNSNKALNILNFVGKMKPFNMDSEIKFEYSNNSFHTAQLFVNDFEIKENSLLIKLAVQKTACKAEDVCIVDEKEPAEACCEPVNDCC